MVTQQHTRHSVNYPKGRDANTKLMELDWDEIPALIGLGSPPIHFNKSQRVLRTRIFNFLIEKCKQQPYVIDHWKRFALSHALLNADCYKTANLPFSTKCELILEEKWDTFTLGKFKGKFSKIQQVDRDTTDENICNENIDIEKKTNNLLKMIQKGELSRGLEQFLSDAKMAARGEDTYTTLLEKHPRADDESSDGIDNINTPGDELKAAARRNPIEVKETIKAVNVQKKGRSYSTCLSRSEHL